MAERINEPELRTFVLNKCGNEEDAIFSMFKVNVTNVEGKAVYRYDGKEKSLLQSLLAALIRSDVIIIAINDPESLPQA